MVMAAQQLTSCRRTGAALTVALPDLHLKLQATGIGRVLKELQYSLRNDVSFTNVPVRRLPVPILNRFTGRIDCPSECDLVLMPMMTDCHLAVSFGLPRIVMVYDVGVVDCDQDKEDSTALGRMYVRRSLRFLHQADLVITPSSFTRDRLLAYSERLDADQVRVIHLGVSAGFHDHLAIRKNANRSWKK
jgi:hypothetical protein